MNYRVREARVECCDGYKCWKARRFMAERRVIILRLFGFWWPVSNAEWRDSENEAARDVANDVELRKPLAAIKLYDFG